MRLSMNIMFFCLLLAIHAPQVLSGQAIDHFTIDEWLRPDASAMVTGVEDKRSEKVREVHMQPGERWTEAKYHEMNVRYQEQTLEHLRDLASKDEPFFLQYWPLG